MCAFISIMLPLLLKAAAVHSVCECVRCVRVYVQRIVYTKIYAIHFSRLNDRLTDQLEFKFTYQHSKITAFNYRLTTIYG